MNWKTQYLRSFDDGIDVLRSFNIGLNEIENMSIAIAIYNIDGYEGDAYVLLWAREVIDNPNKEGHKRLGTLALYEVSGSHCSCYGLEDQWKPDRTTMKAIQKRIEEGNNYGAFALEEKQIKRFLAQFNSYLKEYDMIETPLPEVTDEID